MYRWDGLGSYSNIREFSYKISHVYTVLCNVSPHLLSFETAFRSLVVVHSDDALKVETPFLGCRDRGPEVAELLSSECATFTVVGVREANPQAEGLDFPISILVEVI